MPKHRKQHYVPRFYLKGFSLDGKSINIWNLQRRLKIHSANLKNQCSKDYFYSKQLDVEEALGKIEGEMAKILKIVKKCRVLPPLGSLEHFVIVLYVLMQYGRTKYSADAANEMHDKVMKHLLRPMAEARGISIDEVMIGIEDVPRYSLAQFTLGYPLLLDLDYTLLTNNTVVEFVTSDNPVVFYNQLFSFRNFGSNTGLAEKGLQIFFPIGPKDVLLFCDANVYTIGKRSRRIVEVKNPKDIYEINTLQMCSASSNLYFRDEALDIESLHRKASRFRRQKKASIGVFSGGETKDYRDELVSMSWVDVKTNLTLSFLRLKRSTKRWIAKFRRQKSQPVFIPRNQDHLDDYHEFMNKVNNKEYAPAEFFRYLESREC